MAKATSIVAVGPGCVEKQKARRWNRYHVAASTHFRHGLEADVSLGLFADLVLGRHPRAD